MILLFLSFCSIDSFQMEPAHLFSCLVGSMPRYHRRASTPLWNKSRTVPSSSSSRRTASPSCHKLLPTTWMWTWRYFRVWCDLNSVISTLMIERSWWRSIKWLIGLVTETYSLGWTCGWRVRWGKVLTMMLLMMSGIMILPMVSMMSCSTLIQPSISKTCSIRRT